MVFAEVQDYNQDRFIHHQRINDKNSRYEYVYHKPVYNHYKTVPTRLNFPHESHSNNKSLKELAEYVSAILIQSSWREYRQKKFIDKKDTETKEVVSNSKTNKKVHNRK